MFEVFRCEDCVHGVCFRGDVLYYCTYDFDIDDNMEQCEEYYEDIEED